jgi:hypothetical protein
MIGEDWGICWGCADDALAADKFSDKLSQLLNEEPFDRAKIEVLIEKCLGWVKKQYPERPLSVIVGLMGHATQIEPEWHLYRGDSETACLAPVPSHYCCEGMDVTLAEFFLRNTLHPLTQVDEAIDVGLFVTGLMKKYATGVGGDTTVYSYNLCEGKWVPLLDPMRRMAQETLIPEIEKLITGELCRSPKLHGMKDITGVNFRLTPSESQKSEREP